MVTAYTTDTEVKEFLASLQPATAYAGVSITNMITRAQNKIDAKLAGRYVVPFTTVPPLIKDIATEIAAYLVYRVLHASVEVATKSKPTIWYQSFLDAMETLQSLANYEESLVDANGNVIAERGSRIESTTQGYATVFDMDKEENWVIDATQQEDIASERNG